MWVHVTKYVYISVLEFYVCMYVCMYLQGMLYLLSAIAEITGIAWLLLLSSGFSFGNKFLNFFILHIHADNYCAFIVSLLKHFCLMFACDERSSPMNRYGEFVLKYLALGLNQFSMHQNFVLFNNWLNILIRKCGSYSASYYDF